MSDPIRLGIIGGSGLYNMKELTDRKTVEVSTPFGDPSCPPVTGAVGGKRVAFIARHGLGHVKTPGEVNYRANIFALKSLGVRFIIGVSACGSLNEAMAPGHIVIPDQLVDFTKGTRQSSFFGGGLVAHAGTAEPFCQGLRPILFKASSFGGKKVHDGGAFITIEGPRFSSRGESRLYRQWGLDIIGMTTSPEAFLAREAEISYAVMAHVTDYDVWHEEPVSTEMVIRTFSQNIDHTHEALVRAVGLIDENADFESHHALKGSFMTAKEKIPRETLEKLKPIIGNYF
ncbi:MAG: S-methyl-5'-thioadenosine phosphorylase [Spirochaetales bacterium]|nr:MAG: S-methyl-5'-thioadenosine phosphorylase [Spirochaetales bacterium]